MSGKNDDEVMFVAKVVKSMLIVSITAFISPASMLNIQWIGCILGIIAEFSKLLSKKEEIGLYYEV